MTLSPAIDQDKYCLLYIMRFEAMIRLALLHNKQLSLESLISSNHKFTYGNAATMLISAMSVLFMTEFANSTS